MYNPSGAFNPFGPQATLGSDQVFARASPGPPSAAAVATAAPDFIHAPQGRVPTSVASLAPPQVASRPESRPDFLRGFGVDIPEEEEPEEEEPEQEEVVVLAAPLRTIRLGIIKPTRATRSLTAVIPLAVFAIILPLHLKA